LKLLEHLCSFFSSEMAPGNYRGLFFCTTLKRAMHKADGDLMESTTDTNRRQADKLNSQLTDGNEDGGGENAC